MSIAITGLGCVTGLGSDAPSTHEALARGVAKLARPTHFHTAIDVPVVELAMTNADLANKIGCPECAQYPRTVLLGLLAASEAYHQAHLRDGEGRRVALVSATTTGGMDLSEQYYAAEHAGAKAEPRLLRMHDAGFSSQAIAKHLGIRHYVTTISTACSSAANAILLGKRLLQCNMADVVLAGGCEALTRFTLNGFAALGLLDPLPSRPFDKSRAGLNLGEGAGYVVMEREGERDVEMLARLVGAGNANDAYHQTASSPNGEGAFLAMRAALADAGVTAEQVDYINAHGTGTPNNDETEYVAFTRVFGERVPPYSSTKSSTGHTLGAAGGVEAVLSVQALMHGVVYANRNITEPDSSFAVPPVMGYERRDGMVHVMSNTFGFGGNCTSLLFAKGVTA